MTASDRFHALDAARAAALLLGIVLHATMSFFLPIPAVDVSQSTTLGVTFYVIHLFRMCLFYFIAGFFAHLVFHRRGARAFVRDRAKRILLPMTAGWLVLAPPTIVAVIWGLTRSFPNGPPPGAETAIPEGFPLTHLWFLYYLTLFYALTLALRALFVTLVDRSGALRGRIDTFVGFGLSSYLAPVVLAAPIFAVLYTTATWPVWFGIPTPDTGFTPKIPALAGFGTAFAFGWILHRQAAALGVLEKQWLVNLTLAVGLTIACLAIVGIAPDLAGATTIEGGAGMRAVYTACYTAAIWFWTFGLVGAAMRLCSQPSELRRYLADSSYWLYLGHLPIVFLLQAALMKVPLHWAIKFPLIVAITLAVLLVSYHYLVRPTWIGALLNGRKYPRGARAVEPPAAGSGTAPASIAVLALLLGAIVTTAYPAPTEAQQQDPFGGLYKESCSVCHGEQLEGAAQGSPLVGELRHGDSVAELMKSIAVGFAAAGMPAWSATLNETQIQRLAIFIAEQRSKLAYTDFKIAAPPIVPDGVIRTEKHAFRIETVVAGLDRLPYSIAPLPDGRILLTEKTRGLSIVSAKGERSALIRGTPQVYDDGFQVPGILMVYGSGYLMDVAPHPDYTDNGWIYLHFTDRCRDCNAASRASGRPASMNKVIRGRIEDGAWVDQQTIWQTDTENYTSMPDMAAGGRLAFDDAGHVFFSVGIKGGSEFAGVQDLSLPYGKIHRVNDDGSVPADNPFVDSANALETIWTYGHRSPQGLEFDATTRQLWGTEMGQRGGDEVNLLVPGRNYGWPLVSKGLKYDGTPVDYGKELGIELDPNAIEQPVVDLTPSPAVSSFVVYAGRAFPNWRGNLLVGTLKATELYSMVVEGDRVVGRETLLAGLGRIRDIEVGADGMVYLLLEHASEGRILRLVPER